MPAHTARSRSLQQQDSVLRDPRMAERKENSFSAAGQTRYHPYAKEHIVQGNLGTRTAYQISENGQKTHPDWKYRGNSYGDVGLESSDGVLFWVPPYILMAFSDTLRERYIHSRNSRKHATTDASRSRVSAVPGERKLNIVFDMQTTHHRVLAMFLAFTKGDHNAIEIFTALQYRQCVFFARTYHTQHFLTLLTEKALPKVIDLDPMGTWAYACETDDDHLAKQCFPHMADHWCISVESESRCASWSVFATGVYSADTPMKCADAFASQIGLAKFRAFLSACDKALNSASRNGNTLQEQSQQDAAVSSTRMLVESETCFIVVEGKGMWEQIYRDTMASAAFNAVENDIIVWADDLEETASGETMSDLDAPDGETAHNQRFNGVSTPSENSGSSVRSDRVLAENSDPGAAGETESDAMVSPQLVFQSASHGISPRQRIHSSGSFPPAHSGSPDQHAANGDMMLGNMPNGYAYDQRNRDRNFGLPGDSMDPNDPESDEAMEDDSHDATAV